MKQREILYIISEGVFTWRGWWVFSLCQAQAFVTKKQWQITPEWLRNISQLYCLSPPQERTGVKNDWCS